MGKTKINWATDVWNPVTGCDKVSAGCDNCYARRMANRLRGRCGYPQDDPFKVTLHPDRLDQPLHWRKPRMIFVCSMGDLWHKDVPDDFISQVFAVIERCKQHVFIILTKRPKRMHSILSNPDFPFMVAQSKDEAIVKQTEPDREVVLPISDYPGYYVSNYGHIYSDNRGRRRKMSPDVSKQGYCRVQLHRDGAGRYGDRKLVHRIVLETFVGTPSFENSQVCHLDGNPTNNVISNLRWGNQSDNWKDRIRHGKFRAHSKLKDYQVAEIRSRYEKGESKTSLGLAFDISDVQIGNIVGGKQWNVASSIDWPLRNCWLGVSIEDQKTADERIVELLKVPAAVRMVSIEPMIGAVDLHKSVRCGYYLDEQGGVYFRNLDGISWVICGGETGPGARPMNPEWARRVRDQCEAAGVPYFHKQNGMWTCEKPDTFCRISGKRYSHETVGLLPDGSQYNPKRPEDWGQTTRLYRVTKKQAGRLLDGREYNEIPET